MTRKIITPPGMAAPKAPYSFGVQSGGMIFVAGMVATDNATSALVGKGDIRKQTRQCIHNIRTVLNAGGADLQDVVKTTVYLRDFADYAGMNEVYAEFFPEAPPARATVRAELVSQDFLVEIDAIALSP